MSANKAKPVSADLLDNFVYYPLFKAVLAEIDKMHSIAMRKRQPRGVALEGPTGVGKSAILDVLGARNPVRDTPEGIEIPFFRIETPSPITLKGFVRDMLDLIGDPNADKGTVPQLTRRLIGLCRACKVEYLAFDDFQHLYDDKTDNVTTEVSEWLKVFIKELSFEDDHHQIPRGITVIVTGIDESIAKILSSNDQLKRLFPSTPELMPFRWNDQSAIANQDFIDFVLGLAKLEEIDLQPRASLELYRRIQYATNGTADYIATMFAYIRETFENNGKRIVTLDDLSIAFDKAVISALPVELENTVNPFRIPLDQRFVAPPPTPKKSNNNDAPQVTFTAR